MWNGGRFPFFVFFFAQWAHCSLSFRSRAEQERDIERKRCQFLAAVKLLVFRLRLSSNFMYVNAEPLPRAITIMSDGFVVDAATAAAVWQAMPHTDIHSRTKFIFTALDDISSVCCNRIAHIVKTNKNAFGIPWVRTVPRFMDSRKKRGAATVKYVQQIKSSDAIRWEF